MQDPATEESAARIPPRTGKDAMFFVRLWTMNMRFRPFVCVETGYIEITCTYNNIITTESAACL